MWGLSRCCIGIWSELKWGGSAKTLLPGKNRGCFTNTVDLVIKKGGQSLGRVGHRVAISMWLFVCAIGCSFFRPLIGPDILNVSPWILYAFNIMWQIAHVACPTSCWLTSSRLSNLWVDTSNLHVTTQTLVTCAIYLHNYVHFVIVYLTLCALLNKVSITTLSDSVGPF